jgi:16S rRNA (cytosine967-C5)-methyltransferase
MDMRAALGLEIRAAANALEAMRQGEALPSAIAEARKELPKESWSAVQDMAYQAVRQLGLCLSLAELLNNKAPPPEVLAIQIVTLTQLIEGRRPAAIVLDQVVEACKADINLRFSAGFLNAVMRRFLREQEALMAQAAKSDQAKFKLPNWWIELLRRDHPQAWQQIIANSGAKSSMTLRVNQRKISLEAYCQLLSAQGMAYEVMADAARSLDSYAPPSSALEGVSAAPSPASSPLVSSVHGTPALRLLQAVDVQQLPGWDQGLVSVQDLGAQLAAPLLQVETGMRVLDACAAPGGKAAHLLESLDCEVTALEIDPERAERIQENLHRLGLDTLAKSKTEIKIGDASRPKAWWDGQLYDRILVDAPCSASGIVGRHPDIPWLRRRSDIATLSGQQGKILHALWPLLKPGGKLLLCTCSVFRDEGEYLLANLLRELRDVEVEPLSWRFGSGAGAPQVDTKLSHLLPTRLPYREHDGFFYARLKKVSPSKK